MTAALTALLAATIATAPSTSLLPATALATALQISAPAAPLPPAALQASAPAAPLPAILPGSALLATMQRVGHPALGWIIPGAIFIVSFVLTWMVYRHFSRKSNEF